VDVFAMPQSGTGVSVEAVDPVFQTKMLDLLKQTNRCAYCACSCAIPHRVLLYQATNGRWLVSLSPWVRVLALWRRRQHAAGLYAFASRPLLTSFFGLQSFEQLNKRAVAVVVDPIQSVKGKVQPRAPDR
jgi:26S proteasome regulatory subunit N11